MTFDTTEWKVIEVSLIRHIEYFQKILSKKTLKNNTRLGFQPAPLEKLGYTIFMTVMGEHNMFMSFTLRNSESGEETSMKEYGRDSFFSMTADAISEELKREIAHTEVRVSPLSLSVPSREKHGIIGRKGDFTV